MPDSLSYRLFLVRHGENPANIDKVFSSKLVDQSLTAKGLLQAGQTAAHFRNLNINKAGWTGQAVFSSPLRRAFETASIIAESLNLEVVIQESFREIDVGALEQRPATQADWDFHQKVMDDWFSGHKEARFPEGEDYTDLWARMERGLVKVTKGRSGQNIIIVGHGGILSATMMDLCPGIDIDWLRKTRWDNCAITEIDLRMENGRPEGRLVSWNGTDHLSGAASELIPGVPENV
jgi:broad specificity phosphatase PhoE